MMIARKIGRYEVCVESSEPCGIYLEEAAVPDVSGGCLVLGRSEILDILANGDDYMPLTLRWELLDRCNFACPFCYIVGHSFKTLLRFYEIENHLAKIIEEGLLFCTLTGGEVTIHPDFRHIYKFLKERGVIVDVYTNCFAIDNEIIELFRSHPPNAVEVSLYSLDNTRLREIYGVHDNKGAARVLENVLRLKKASVNVICKTFFNTVTKPDIRAIASWCKKNNVEHKISSEITRAYDGADIGIYEVKKPVIHKRAGKAVCFPCKTKNYGSAIDASFSIFPCPSIMLRDCTFDLRQLGVSPSLRLMKAFMRRFQDSEILGSNGKLGGASCMAYANPVRNEAGEIMHFEHT